MNRFFKKYILIAGSTLFLLSTPTLAENKESRPTIRSIRIQVRDIFDRPDLSWLYRTANQLKANTRKEVIRRELLLREGEGYSEFSRTESLRNLRSLKFIRQVEIIPHRDGDVVDVDVIVQDTWTLIPIINFSSGDGRSRRSAGVAESNIGGYGKRLEFLYEEDENREILEGVWEDPRLFGTYHRALFGVFDRNDGERFVGSLGRPFRSLLEKYSWNFDADIGDTVGRLFEAGDESFIYRQDVQTFDAGYTFSTGSPEKRRRRFTFGYRYIDRNYSQATLNDFSDLNLDPDIVSNDPALLAENRRFSGPTFTYQYIQPDYIYMNYIDRFDRVEDYNLGLRFSTTLHFAPESLGSHKDSLLFSTNLGKGWKFDAGSFFRGETGLASRLDDSGLEDTLARIEGRYYKIIGPVQWKDIYLGKHTLAASFLIDYGDDLDRNRQLAVGGDNLLRGYDARTFNGDKRFALNLEERMALVEDWLSLISIGASVFLDIGGATNKGFAEMFSRETYADIGIGLNFAFPRSSGGKVLRAEVAFPLRDGPDGSDQLDPRFLISGGQLFGSRLRSEAVGSERASVSLGLDN